MQLKDVIQYYSGQKWRYKDFADEWTAWHEFKLSYIERDVKSPQLALRRLSDMEEEECIYVTGVEKYPDLVVQRFQKSERGIRVDFKFKNPNSERNNPDGWSYLATGFGFEISEYKPHIFHYLLQRGFDLFGLIDSGQAVDVKTIKQ